MGVREFILIVHIKTILPLTHSHTIPKTKNKPYYNLSLPKNHFGSERWLGLIHFVGSGVGHKILVGIVHTCLEVMISPVMQLLCQHNPGEHG